MLVGYWRNCLVGVLDRTSEAELLRLRVLVFLSCQTQCWLAHLTPLPLLLAAQCCLFYGKNMFEMYIILQLTKGTQWTKICTVNNYYVANEW